MREQGHIKNMILLANLYPTKFLTKPKTAEDMAASLRSKHADDDGDDNKVAPLPAKRIE